MSRRFTPKVVTANALLEGDAVWLRADGSWSRDMHEAQLFEEEELATEALTHALAQPDLVVGAYLADAEAGPTGPVPTHFREAFRTRGPSNYNHGKQAEA
ncbi:DUF2849 domain-containing protein [Pseudoroseicyclus sp. CXY001]|uniref:DUF2849 domain-containing protein n=1 Tax=Pseudoroseicyclus sp. CXY001 TaxID=3242492 RepID=UPI00358DA72A